MLIRRNPTLSSLYFMFMLPLTFLSLSWVVKVLHLLFFARSLERAKFHLSSSLLFLFRTLSFHSRSADTERQNAHAPLSNFDRRVARKCFYWLNVRYRVRRSFRAALRIAHRPNRRIGTQSVRPGEIIQDRGPRQWSTWRGKSHVLIRECRFQIPCSRC
jgi:hypothetical protein